MSDRTAAEMYNLCKRTARRLWGRRAKVWRDREYGWHGDSCVISRADPSGGLITIVRAKDWWEAHQLLLKTNRIPKA